MTIFQIIVFIIILGLIIFYVFLFLLESKINAFEMKIKSQFEARNSLIPAIHDVSKNHLYKHTQIFEELIKLRKRSFIQKSFNQSLGYTLENEQKIHKELNFIFRVCNAQAELLKEGKFIYLRELIINKSFDLGESLKKYKSVTNKYNKLVTIKNFTIIGLLIPIDHKYFR